MNPQHSGLSKIFYCSVFLINLFMLLKQFGNIMVDQVTIPIIICGLVHKSGMYNISYIYSLSIRLIVTYSSLEGILNQSSHSASKKLNSQSHHTIFYLLSNCSLVCTMSNSGLSLVFISDFITGKTWRVFWKLCPISPKPSTIIKFNYLSQTPMFVVCENWNV